MKKITDHILHKVEKPSRYVGGELNQVVKNPKDVDIRFAFCFPDVYEVGMSHLGTRILYHTINEEKIHIVKEYLHHGQIWKLSLEKMKYH